MIEFDFLNYCDEKGYKPFRVMGTQRDKKISEQRRDIIKHLHGKGHLHKAIAAVLNKDVSAVYYHVNDQYRAKRKERMREYNAETKKVVE